MKYYISMSSIRGGEDYEKVAQFEAKHVKGMDIDAADEVDAIEQFNRYVEKAQPKLRATASGIDWGMKLLVVLVGEYDNGMKYPVRWIVKENK